MSVRLGSVQCVCASDGGGHPGEEVGGMLGREEEGRPWSLQGVCVS